MIIEGLKLMLLGMGVVFVFLTLLFFILTLSSTFLKASPPEKAASTNQKARLLVADGVADNIDKVLLEDRQLVAVISAAIAKYRQ